MQYVEGIGYIDGSSYAVNNVKQTPAASGTSFDNILTEETDKLNAQTTSYNLDDIFRKASEKYNVSYDLLKAIAYNESRFQPQVTSSAGAIGIMQLMPSTAKAMGVENAYDPYQNIMGGARLLSTLSDMYDGNQTLMIAAYNAGSGAVAKYGGVPPYTETQNYVAKIFSTMQSGIDISGMTVTYDTSGNANASGSYQSAVTDGQTVSNRQSAVSGNQSFIYGTRIAENTQNALSYQEYQLLMTYYDTMMDIIGSIGDTDSEGSDSSSNDSLSDLFRLGTQSAQDLINANTLNANTINTIDQSDLRSILASSISYNRSNIDL